MDNRLAGFIGEKDSSMDEFYDTGDDTDRQRKERVRGYATLVATLVSATVIIFVAGIVSLHA